MGEFEVMNVCRIAYLYVACSSPTPHQLYSYCPVVLEKLRRRGCLTESIREYVRSFPEA